MADDPRSELIAAYTRYIEQEQEVEARAQSEIERQHRIIEGARAKIDKYRSERDAL